MGEAGCDEAGRGCLAGPVVAAAVIWPADTELPLLNDSKKLTALQREALVPRIKAKAIAWAIGLCSPEEIDRINILKASFLAMHRALDQLAQVPEHILVDGNRFTAYKTLSHDCIIKGDGRYASIAAASILAKTKRDAMMQAYAMEYPHYGWESNKGYPTPFHKKALMEHGPCPLHRKSFTLKSLDLFA
jgi:ribonuclease HII